MKILLKTPLCEHFLLNSPLLKIALKENFTILNLLPTLHDDNFHEWKIIPF